MRGRNFLAPSYFFVFSLEEYLLFLERRYKYINMKKKISILVIQFRLDESELHEQVCLPDKFISLGEEEIYFHFLNAFDMECGWDARPEKVLNGFDGVILGGSSEFYFGGNVTPEKELLHGSMLDRMKSLIEYLLEQDFPTLGICFGHQMLGHFLGVYVVDDPKQAESGSFSVTMTERGKTDPLLAGLNREFKAFFVHRDSLESLPNGCELLARSERCRVAAFRYKQNIYGVQFHPELSQEDVLFRVNLHPELLKVSLQDFSNSIQPIPDAPRILINFANLAGGRAVI